MRQALICLLVIFSFAPKSFGQRVIMFCTTSINSVTHGTCYGGNGQTSVKLTVVRTSGNYAAGAYTLNVAKDGVAYTTISASPPPGVTSVDVAVNNLPPGTYKLNGTISLYDPVNQTSYGLVTIPDTYVKIGYQAVWSSLKEMAVQTLPSSVLQNVITPTQTYSGARSSNDISTASWVIAGANFSSGSSANRSVYLSLGNTAALVSFSPSQTGYVEFRKGGTATATAGDGVYVKFSGTVYKLNGVTQTDRIRVERTGNSLSFFANQATTALAGTNVSSAAVTSPLTVTYSAQVNYTAFATVSGDGLLDVASSDVCNSSTDTYASLDYELDGFYYVMKQGKLRFIFNNEYDSQTKLIFNIYRGDGLLVKTQANYPDVAVTNGDNYITLDLTATNGCLGKGMYYIEVINDKKEKFYLRFYSDYSIICEQEQEPGGPILGG